MTRYRISAALRGDDGSATVWLLLMIPAMFAFAALVVDGGRVITARQQAANLAEQGARVAVDQLDIGGFRVSGSASAIAADAAGAAACSYTTQARPDAGCSASVAGDGLVNVTVTVTTETGMLAMVGVSSITVDGTGTARPAIGATEEVIL